MFSFFKSDPLKKLRRKKSKLLEEAMQIQRTGNLKLYAAKIEEAEALEGEIERIKKEIP